MLPINDNSINLSKYRGQIKRCPICTPANASKERVDSIQIERLTLGKACSVCLGHGFVAVCKNCSGTGIYQGSAISFGGSDVPHQSACNPCGASGFFAVRKPADWTDEPAPEQKSVASIPVAV
jgi:hypothetical protein